METLRVAFADLDPTADPDEDPWVVVRLPSDDAHRLNAEFAGLISRSMGGVRVVLVTRDTTGDLRTWGNAALTRRVATFELDALPWVTRHLFRSGPGQWSDLAAWRTSRSRLPAPASPARALRPGPALRHAPG